MKPETVCCGCGKTIEKAFVYCPYMTKKKEYTKSDILPRIAKLSTAKNT